MSANEGDFSKREVAGVKKTQELYRKIGYTGYKIVFKLLEKDYFRNYPVTTNDAKGALYIYVVDLAVLKGKMTRPSAAPIVNRPPVTIPKTITDLHSTINLSVDYLFIQSIPFLHTFSRGYEFRTIYHINGKRKLKKKWKKVLRKQLMCTTVEVFTYTT